MKRSNGTQPHAMDPLMQGIEAVEAFSNLPEDIHREIANQIETVELAPNEVLVRQGEDARSLYILLHGRLLVILKDPDGGEQIVGDLKAGSIVGEIALVVGGKRSATVVGKEASTLGVLSAEALNRLMSRYPQVVANMVSMASGRLREGQLTLHLLRLYEGLNDVAIKEIQSAAGWISLSAGEILFRKGEPADAAYLVVSGRLCKQVAPCQAGAGRAYCTGRECLEEKLSPGGSIQGLRNTHPRSPFPGSLCSGPPPLRPGVGRCLSRPADRLPCQVLGDPNTGRTVGG